MHQRGKSKQSFNKKIIFWLDNTCDDEGELELIVLRPLLLGNFALSGRDKMGDRKEQDYWNGR